MHATVSFLGLYNYDNTIFDELQVPAGVDKTLVQNTLMMETADLEVMQPDPVIMRKVLGWFSQRRLDAWTRVYTALSSKYQADTDVEVTETRTPDLSYIESRTPNLTTTGQNNGADTTTTKRAGFNAGNLETAEQMETSLGTGNTIHSTGNETTDRTESGSETKTTTGRHQAAQDLIAKELQLAMTDTVEYIVKDIRRNFCLLVY